MISIAFFNNKGGVGKTSLVYHTAWMFAELGHRVLAVDLDPQSNLSIMALDEERLEALWPDDEHPQTLHGAVAPLFGGTGDIRPGHIEAMAGKLGLLVGDLALSRIEDRMPGTRIVFYKGFLDPSNPLRKGAEAALAADAATVREEEPLAGNTRGREDAPVEDAPRVTDIDAEENAGTPQACASCDAPTYAETCSFCRLKERVRKAREQRAARESR